MKHIDTMLLVLSLSAVAFGGCKKVTVGKSGHGGGGAVAAKSADGELDSASAAKLLEESAEGLEADVAAEEAAYTAAEGGDAAPAEGEEVAAEDGGEEAPAEGEASDIETRFSLAKLVKTNPRFESLRSNLDEAATMLGLGDQGKFRIETNATFGVSPDFDKGESERKLVTQHWLKWYVANKLLKGEGSESDYMLDTGAEAILDHLNIDMHFRIAGEDVASRSILAGFDQTLTREKGFEVSYVIVKLESKIGGEMGLRTEFGVRRDNVLSMIYTPTARLHAFTAAGLDVGGGGVMAEGTINLIDMQLKGAGAMGFMKDLKLLYADIGLDKNAVKLVDGKIELVTRVPVIKTVINRTALWDPAPMKTMALPLFGTEMIKFLKAPAGRAACDAATASAASKLSGNLGKMASYIAAAPEDDKVTMKGGIGRTGFIFRKLQAYCKDI